MLMTKAVLTRKARAVLKREIHACEIKTDSTGRRWRRTPMKWWEIAQARPAVKAMVIIHNALQLLPLP
jgi:hypothetical protein